MIGLAGSLIAMAANLATTAVYAWVGWYRRSPVIVGFATLALIVGFVIGWPAALVVAVAGGFVWHKARGSMRRRWTEALALCGLREHVATGPIRETASGHAIEVSVGHGASLADLSRQSERLAAHLRMFAVRIEPHPHSAGHALVRVVDRDYLAGVSRPWRQPERPSLWDLLSVGFDEEGADVSFLLCHVLIGGQTGSGKTRLLQLLLLIAALSDAHIWICDGKYGVDLGPWIDRADGYADNITDANTLLLHVLAQMEDRYAWMREHDVDEVRPGMPLHLVVVEELPFFTLNAAPAPKGGVKPADEFTSSLVNLITRGRQAGFRVVALAQKPVAEMMPTTLRDQFAVRIALSCGNRYGSEAVLGECVENAADLPLPGAGETGLGYLREGNGRPRRFRSYYVDQETVRTVARKAAR